MDNIRWGIIGCGDVTEVKSGPALQKAPHSELIAVMRRDADKARDYAERHNVPKWSTDASQLIEDPEIDMLYIATPPDSHREYTLRTAEAGKPVYVEKPMARSHDECIEMIDACRKAGVRLFVAYYRRRLPRFLKVLELLKRNAIGTPRFVHVELYQPPFREDLQPETQPWRVIPEVAGGGYFIDLASHTLDLLDFFLGPIAEAEGMAANHQGLYPAEDIVSSVFRFESGILGTGTWCFSGHDRKDQVEIIGDRGLIRFSTFQEAPVLLETGRRREQFEIAHPHHIQQPLIESVIADMRGEGECPSTGESAARTSRVMDRMLSKWRSEKGITF